MEVKKAKFKRSSINLINQMRKNLKGSKRRSWDKYGSLVGFKKKLKNRTYG